MFVERREGAYLPHWRTDSAIYAVTFRLADSIPKDVMLRWTREREILLRRVAAGVLDLTHEEQQRVSDLSDRIEDWLDRGVGSCLLRQELCARIVHDALFHFAGERYQLGAWCIMPNHVHVIVRPAMDLSKVLHSWKSFTSLEIRRALGPAAPAAIWQRESYDRIIRDATEFGNQMRYVLDNPAKAGLSDWPWVGTGGLRWGEA